MLMLALGVILPLYLIAATGVSRESLMLGMNSYFHTFGQMVSPRFFVSMNTMGKNEVFQQDSSTILKQIAFTCNTYCYSIASIV